MSVIGNPITLGGGGGSPANQLTGTVTLNSRANTIAISCPFQPKVFMLKLRSMPSTATSYSTFFEIGGFFERTENVDAYQSTFTNSFTYEFDGTYNGSSRGTSMAAPTYENGVLTFRSRSSSIYFAAGTYDYIIAG